MSASQSTAALLGILDADTSGMGRHPHGTTCYGSAVLSRYGYSYSHSVGVWHHRDFPTLHHVWKSSIGDHRVAVFKRGAIGRYGSGFPCWEGSHGGSALAVYGCDSDELAKYLRGVSYRLRRKAQQTKGRAS